MDYEIDSRLMINYLYQCCSAIVALIRDIEIYKIVLFEFLILYFIRIIFERKIIKNLFFIAIKDLEEVFFLVSFPIPMKLEKKNFLKEEFEQLWSESSINHGVIMRGQIKETIILDERLENHPRLSDLVTDIDRARIFYSRFNPSPFHRKCKTVPHTS